MTRIIPGTEKSSRDLKESSHTFRCPANRALTGRLHGGDENGFTRYLHAALTAYGGRVITTDHHWSNSRRESSSGWYVAPGDRVFVGREHEGDENGLTRYQHARVVFVSNTGLRRRAKVVKRSSSRKYEESGHSYFCPSGKLMTGRYHRGDENGQTRYESGLLKTP